MQIDSGGSWGPTSIIGKATWWIIELTGVFHFEKIALA
jgi:hypothetical protein